MQNPFTFEAEPFEGYAAFDELESFDEEQLINSRGKATPSQMAAYRNADIQEEEGAAGGASPAPQRSTSALASFVPDIPNYPRNTPIYYWLNAKEIVGEVAQDISSKGKSAHVWVELGHLGVATIEALELAGTGLLAGGLALAGPLLAVVAIGLGLGAPYQEAAEEIAAKWSATGFSRGVVMGADGRQAKLVKDYFGDLYFSPDLYPFLGPRGSSLAMANYRMGLLVGYVQGRKLSTNQRAIFWRDLGYRIGDMSYLGSSQQWGRGQWVDWYIKAAVVFRRDHLV
jgi:hypothetical protein